MAEAQTTDWNEVKAARAERNRRLMSNANPDQEARDRTLAEIRELGLETNVAELDAIGYTTVKGAIDADQVAGAKAAIVRVMERKSGMPVDIESETAEAWNGVSLAHYLLYEDEVFESIITASKPLALISYLLGRSCVLSSMTCHFKGRGSDPLMLHSDNGNGITPPFSMISQVANVNYALTPYSKEAGALAMVPGSHRLCRHPRPDESQLAGDACNPDAVSMPLEPGDCVVWHGNTWHGSFRREIPGIRMNLATYFARQYIVTQEEFGRTVPQEMLDRHANDQRFLRLVGQRQPYNYHADGPDWSKFADVPRGQWD
ncbi:MAG: phytanoyl-CoA dioxygenase family protein [Gammaproteobacteria bacterium]|nr:phytanoyl-CoA dioxygenase family protein [Gammaproteobacteria bacterium]